ncbi:MAG: orotidine-5'-phosphate decarboxylase [Actinobacteria bacterium]|nr:orotidine-5'-phosphate decarboxylase [Actinomycetota bacterium]
MKSSSRVILALDFNDIQSSRSMINQTREFIDIYKLGLEFYLANGKAAIRQIQKDFSGIEIFLDLKLHDIPNTVAGACKSLSDINPRFLTVHASGGAKMIRAAAQAVPNVAITAVTILTSLDEQQMKAMGQNSSIKELTLQLARNAVSSGATAIVCSPLEASLLREELGKEITLITPGVRPAGSERDDQERVMTPKQAIAAGADFVVVGRPITKAINPMQAAEAITSSLA